MYDTEYELTKYGQTLKPVIDVIASPGVQHRERVIKEMRAKSRSKEKEILQ